MVKEHPALQELFKTRASEPLSPLQCLVLIKDSQRVHFYMQTRSLMGCCSRRPPTRRTRGVCSGTNEGAGTGRFRRARRKFFNWALKTLVGVNDTKLSACLNCKATAWYGRFPPISRIAASSFYRTSVIHLRSLSTPQGNKGRRRQGQPTNRPLLVNRHPGRAGPGRAGPGAPVEIAGVLYHTFRSRSAM